VLTEGFFSNQTKSPFNVNSTLTDPLTQSEHRLLRQTDAVTNSFTYRTQGYTALSMRLIFMTISTESNTVSTAISRRECRDCILVIKIDADAAVDKAMTSRALNAIVTAASGLDTAQQHGVTQRVRASSVNMARLPSDDKLITGLRALDDEARVAQQPPLRTEDVC
jgi:hypothetical protein